MIRLETPILSIFPLGAAKTKVVSMGERSKLWSIVVADYSSGLAVFADNGERNEPVLLIRGCDP